VVGELVFLNSEMDDLMNGITEGANRTADIVKGLKTFSRLDENEFKMANVEAGIESSLMVLNADFIDAKIVLEKNYGNMPDIECMPGKLNQVIMNMLENAMHATEGNEEAGKERIVKISTALVKDNAEIKISDNGQGMPKELYSRIFDPFFTTKDVGEGTGLGLSIAYSIIEGHKGKIHVDSTIGEGTEFTIRIPSSQVVEAS